jgi:hypothetical protein
MGHIRDVKKAMDSSRAMFAPLRETVALLRSHGVHVEQQKIGTQSVMEYLETAPLKWDATVNMTFKKKEDIFPLQNAEMDNIKQQVESFFLAMREFRNRFRKTAPFSFSGPAEEAYGAVDAFSKELHTMEGGAAQLNELEEVCAARCDACRVPMCACACMTTHVWCRRCAAAVRAAHLQVQRDDGHAHGADAAEAPVGLQGARAVLVRRLADGAVERRQHGGARGQEQEAVRAAEALRRLQPDCQGLAGEARVSCDRVRECLPWRVPDAS